MRAVAGTATDAKVGDALGAASEALLAAGVPDGRLDAEVLLAAASGRGRASLIADPSGPLPPAVSRLYGEFVRRRLRREPVAYILGRKGFRQIELAVDRRVLIPRPETELLVELALETGARSVLDMGTGSGGIALAIADEAGACELIATDTSAAALAVTSQPGSSSATARATAPEPVPTSSSRRGSSSSASSTSSSVSGRGTSTRGSTSSSIRRKPLRPRM